MSKITKFKAAKLLGTAAVLALAAGGTAHATQTANGTEAGTTVDNFFTLSYQVTPPGSTTPVTETYDSEDPNGDGDTSDADLARFLVDRVVDLTVTRTSNAVIAPASGATTATHTFTVTNDGNSTQAYDLFVRQDTDNSADNFNLDTIVVEYEDPNNAGTFITLAPGTASPDVAPGATLNVRVTSTVPGGTAGGQEADFALIADTVEPAGNDAFRPAGVSAGTPVVASTSNDALTTDTVTRDGAADGLDGVDLDTGASDQGVDGTGDGNGSAFATVSSTLADVTADKTVVLINETPGNPNAGVSPEDSCATGIAAATVGTTETGSVAFAPGACVEYTIAVTNPNTTQANNVSLGDILSESLVFVAAVENFAEDDNGATTKALAEPAQGTACNGTPGSGSPACNIQLTNGAVPGEETRFLRIRALVK